MPLSGLLHAISWWLVFYWIFVVPGVPGEKHRPLVVKLTSFVYFDWRRAHLPRVRFELTISFKYKSIRIIFTDRKNINYLTDTYF